MSLIITGLLHQMKRRYCTKLLFKVNHVKKKRHEWMKTNKYNFTAVGKLTSQSVC